MTLRPYQSDAVKKIMWSMTQVGNDIVCIAQGGGKSLVIAEVAHQIGKVLVICPNKEILEQDLEKMTQYVDREEIGVFSASMGEKTIKNITFGTIQSMYKTPELFKDFKVVIYDECDLHNPKNVQGMSSKLFKAAGITKVFGFTGTPYRQDHYYESWGPQVWMKNTITTTKMINRYPGFFWKRMLVVVNTKELLEQGYLSPIEYHDVSLLKHSQIKLNKSKTEFDLEAFDEQIKEQYVTIARYIENLPHKGKLIFCATIEQAETLQGLISGSVVVTSKTTKKDREKATKGLKNGSIPVIFNVGIYTVGFDYPELECIVLLRPTKSLRLHCQILGRVSRIAPGKEKGHVYDLVSNIKTLGELASIEIKKVWDEKTQKDQWNVVSPGFPGGFHNVPLYTYKLKQPKAEGEIIL